MEIVEKVIAGYGGRQGTEIHLARHAHVYERAGRYRIASSNASCNCNMHLHTVVAVDEAALDAVTCEKCKALAEHYREAGRR